MTNEAEAEVEVLKVTDMVTRGANLISEALAAGAAPEVLKQLMDLQIRWEDRRAEQEYNAAMVEFHKQCPATFTKNRAADFGRGKAAYTYGTMDQLMETVNPHLSANGLSVDHDITQDAAEIEVTCIVRHKGGHMNRGATIKCKADTSGNKNHVQAIGSVITYLRRYTTEAKLGIVATEDDDGASAGPPVEQPGNGGGKRGAASDKQRERLVEYSTHPALGKQQQEWCKRKAADPELTQGQAGEGIGMYKKTVEKWDAEHPKAEPQVDQGTGEVTAPDGGEGPPPDDPDAPRDRVPGEDDE